MNVDNLSVSCSSKWDMISLLEQARLNSFSNGFHSLLKMSIRMAVLCVSVVEIDIGLGWVVRGGDGLVETVAVLGLVSSQSGSMTDGNE